MTNRSENKKRTRNNQDVQPSTGQDVPSAFIRGVDIRVSLYKIIVLHTLKKQLKHLHQKNIHVVHKNRGLSYLSNKSHVEIIGLM